MKKSVFYFLIIFAVIISASGNVYSANEYFRSVASGNWNSTLTWEMSLNNSTWGPATITPSEVSNLITIRANDVVTVTVNVTADQLTINDSAVLVINSGVILSVFNGSGNDLTLLTGSTLNGPGTVRTLGAVNEINLRAGSAFNASLNVNAGITYAYDQTSPYEGSIYGNVTVDNGATLNGGNVSGRDLLLFGNVTNNGTLTVSSTGATMRINGPSLINNGTTSAAGTLYFDSVTTVSGAGTFTPASTVINGNITLGSNITYSPTSNITIAVGGILNPNGNIFTLAANSMTLDNNATISAPGTVRTQNSVAIYLNQLAAFNASLNVNTGDALVTGYVSSSEGKIFGNVTIDAGTTLNGGNISGRDLFIYGNVINNGTLTVSSTGATMRINGPSLINNGTTSAAGTLYFDSVTTVSGAGTFTPASTVINGNITLGSNITYSPTSNITIAVGGILNPNGNIFTLAANSMTLDNNATISAPGTVRTQNSVAIYLNQLAAFNASLNVNTGDALVTGYVSSSEGKIFGNVTIDAGTTLNGGNISGRDLFIYGNVINNGTLFASSSGGTLRIKGLSLTNNGIIYSAGSFFFDTTTALSGSGSFTSGVNLTTNANITLNSNHQMHSVIINAGAIFNISNRWLKLTASNPIIATGTFTSTGSKIEYNGTVLQTVSTTNISYHGLRINNPAGAILSANITIPDTLAVILGDLNLNAKIITLTPSAYMTETPGNVVFGVSGYITTTRNISSPSSLNVAGMGAVLTQASNLGSTEIRRGHTVQTGLNGGTSIKRYYDITPANNSGLNATFVFKYDDSELNGKPEPSLKLFKSTNTGSTWLYEGGTVNISSNEITLSGLTSFSRWSADSSGVSAAITTLMQGFYNNVSNQLSMSDTVRAYLRNSFAPYAVVDSSIGLIDSLTFKSSYQFPNAPDGNYYIQLKHRNSLETWSKFGVNYQTSITLNYDFTFSASQSYGNNTILKGSKYCMYSGDVTQDGYIDLGDVVNIYNNGTLFVNGYVATDVNGDMITDLADVLIAYNNAIGFIAAKTPFNP